MRFSLFAVASLLGLSLASPAERGLTKRNTALNEFLQVLLEFLPALDGTLLQVTGIEATFQQLIADLTGEPTTYNQLGAQACTEYTVIFARGTLDPGNVGILVGPPLFDALKTQFGDTALTIQGVNNYLADINGYLAGGDAAGSAEMAVQINQAYTSCPDTKLIAVGYSQGCQLVHNAAVILTAEVSEWINSVLLFGDPDNGTAIDNMDASKVKTYCHTGDLICVNSDLILPVHLTYGEDATSAAAFVATQA